MPFARITKPFQLAAVQSVKSDPIANDDDVSDRVNPKTGRPQRKSAGRKSLAQGYVDPRIVIDSGNISSSDDDNVEGARSKPWAPRRRPKSPPPPPLSESDDDDLVTDTKAQSCSDFGDFTITVNMAPGHSGPVVIKLPLDSIRQSLAASEDITICRKRPAPATDEDNVPSKVSSKRRKTQKPCQTVGFMSLAAEIRNMIYKLVLVTDTPIDLSHATNFRRSAAILRTCKAVYDEARQILYGRNSFRLERQFRPRARYYQSEWIEVGWKDVRRWLRAIGPVNISYLQHILIKFDDAMPSSNPHLITPEDRRYVHDEHLFECLRMLLAATNLKTLVLSFHGRKQLLRTDHRFLEHLTRLRADTVKIMAHPTWQPKDRSWFGYEGSFRTVRIAWNVENFIQEKMVDKGKLYHCD